MKRQKINIEGILTRLEESPLRITQKRKLILNTLVDSDRPVSAEELRNQAGLPKSDLVTIYRTVEAFMGIGIVQGIPLENGGTIYEITDPGDHHHHLVCRDCHKTERLDLCLGKELEEKARTLGFNNVSHVMEVYGSCEECK